MKVIKSMNVITRIGKVTRGRKLEDSKGRREREKIGKVGEE
jgi:hypothetical protein